MSKSVITQLLFYSFYKVPIVKKEKKRVLERYKTVKK
jgi:hypothetical protein